MLRGTGKARRLLTAITWQVYKASEGKPTAPVGADIPPVGWSVNPPSSGKIWVSTGIIVAGKLHSPWTDPVRWNGDSGRPGVSGQVVRQSEWGEGVEFHNDSEAVTPIRYLDVGLLYASNGRISRYMCRKTHVATEANKPSPAGGEYWELISGDFPLYTPLIVAENGDIKFLQSNRMLIYGADGKVVGGFSGDGWIWMGGESPEAAPFRVDENGKVVANNIDLKGKVTATSGLFNGFVKIPYKKDNSLTTTLPSIDEGTNVMMTNNRGNLSLTLPDDLSYDGIQVEIMNASFSVFALNIYPPSSPAGKGIPLYWRSENIKRIVLLGDYSTVILKAFIAPIDNRLIWRVVNSGDFIKKTENGSLYIQWIQQ